MRGAPRLCKNKKSPNLWSNLVSLSEPTDIICLGARSQTLQRMPVLQLTVFYFFFKKLYFIEYAITVVLIFLLLPPLHPAPPTLSGNPLPLFMSMGHAYTFFGYSLSYTVLYICMATL